jgi:hypothetical protein
LVFNVMPVARCNASTSRAAVSLDSASHTILVEDLMLNGSPKVRCASTGSGIRGRALLSVAARATFEPKTQTQAVNSIPAVLNLVLVLDSFCLLEKLTGSMRELFRRTLSQKGS